MNHIKKILFVLSFLVLMTSCQKNEEKKTEVTTPPVINPEKPYDDKPKSINYPLAIDDALINKLKDLDLSLKLVVEDNKSSQLVAKVDNQSSKVIKNVKVNVHYITEDVDRILYYSTEVPSKEASKEFKIMGPTSNQASDILVKDVTVVYGDNSQLSAVNPNEKPVESSKPEEPKPTPEKPVESEKPQETDKPAEPIEAVNSKTLSIYRFGNFILEGADTIATLNKDNQNNVSLSVKNNSAYTITNYQLTVNINGQDSTFEITTPMKPGESAYSPAQIIENADLESAKPQRLIADADYSNNRILKIEIILSNRISANYKIIKK